LEKLKVKMNEQLGNEKKRGAACHLAQLSTGRRRALNPVFRSIDMIRLGHFSQVRNNVVGE
jgi:hypothetical protein